MTLDGRITDAMSDRRHPAVALERRDGGPMNGTEPDHVLRVFVGPDGRGGNPLGVFLDGAAIARRSPPGGRPELGFSRDGLRRRRGRTAAIRIFTPAAELPFAGHPTVGTSWLLRETRHAGRRSCDRRPATCRPGDEPDRTLDPRPGRVGPPDSSSSSSRSAADVEAVGQPPMGDAGPLRLGLDRRGGRRASGRVTSRPTSGSSRTRRRAPRRC